MDSSSIASRDEFVPAYAMPSSNQRVLLVRRPSGVPLADDFRVEEGAAPRLQPNSGMILVRNIYLSVDPAQRGWATDTANYSAPVVIGEVMRALGVGVVVESSDAASPVGSYVYGWTGWQSYTLMRPADILTRISRSQAPLSAYAGVLGINGLTASIALRGIGSPAPGETVLVSTAAGAVGSIVGQLARRARCHTLGLTGGKEKVRRCVERFGYDGAFDYKHEDVDAALLKHAPAGVNVYFDNVGGALLDLVLRRMAAGGRIVQCGTASVPVWTPPPCGLRNEREVLTRRLRWGGFVIFDHVSRFGDELPHLISLLGTGELTYDENITEGIETAPPALEGLYSGENAGKRLIFIG
jgi:hypothetical protein